MGCGVTRTPLHPAAVLAFSVTGARNDMTEFEEFVEHR